MDSTKCIVETPKGSGIKYDYNSKLACFELGRMLPAGATFPYDFGFIPGTIGEDGDPLDVIIISDIATFTGCAIDCRIIGSIKASQREKNGDEVRNDRFLAIPVKDGTASDIEELQQLPAQKLDELEKFFINYNEQSGKQFMPIERTNASTALKAIDKGKNTPEPTRLIQLLLPLYDGMGKAYPQDSFKTVRKQLLKKFGGVTCYLNSPAKGLWKDDEQEITNDDVVVYEVMAAEIDKCFWKKYKKELKLIFKEESIVIRQVQIGVL